MNTTELAEDRFSSPDSPVGISLYFDRVCEFEFFAQPGDEKLIEALGWMHRFDVQRSREQTGTAERDRRHAWPRFPGTGGCNAEPKSKQDVRADFDSGIRRVVEARRCSLR